jgi:2-polyprenyl-6-hydroxyphenyl methylase/3-demethylubiquinone-9 3-methyltransferase
MRKVPQKTYDRIDNSIYASQSDTWWQPDSVFYQMKVAVNPVRVGYARKILFDELQVDPRGKTALEVGCAGGYITEEIARMGFATTGIDPTAESLGAAVAHARTSGLKIVYEAGVGEAIPFPDRSFDAVFCCDVLEHVRDMPRVISEISRVLKPGGVFVFDTLNRTLVSKLVAIKICQTWKRWAFMPKNLHVWEMFIKPRELRDLLERNGVEWKGIRGIAPDVSFFKALRLIRKRAKGEWTYQDLAARIQLVESRVTAVMYVGYAVKKKRA